MRRPHTATAFQAAQAAVRRRGPPARGGPKGLSPIRGWWGVAVKPGGWLCSRIGFQHRSDARSHDGNYEHNKQTPLRRLRSEPPTTPLRTTDDSASNHLVAYEKYEGHEPPQRTATDRINGERGALDRPSLALLDEEVMALVRSQPERFGTPRPPATATRGPVASIQSRIEIPADTSAPRLRSSGRLSLLSCGLVC